MILTGPEIEKQVSDNRITIDPFDSRALNPNSYDLRLNDHLLVYEEEIIDVAKKNPTRVLPVSPEGLLLKGGGFYLGSSIERVGSEHYVPVLHAKSGTARSGLFVHVTANLIDIGSVGNLTFQLAPVLDVVVRPGMAVAQVSFWRTSGEIALYQGKYAGAAGPQSSRSFVDWADEDSLPIGED